MLIDNLIFVILKLGDKRIVSSTNSSSNIDGSIHFVNLGIFHEFLDIVNNFLELIFSGLQDDVFDIFLSVLVILDFGINQVPLLVKLILEVQRNNTLNTLRALLMVSREQDS